MLTAKTLLRVYDAAQAFVDADLAEDLYDLHSEDPASLAQWERLKERRRQALRDLHDAVRGEGTDADHA